MPYTLVINNSINIQNVYISVICSDLSIKHVAWCDLFLEIKAWMKGEKFSKALRIDCCIRIIT